jgi:hypothetical protein
MFCTRDNEDGYGGECEVCCKDMRYDEHYCCCCHVGSTRKCWFGCVDCACIPCHFFLDRRTPIYETCLCRKCREKRCCYVLPCQGDDGACYCCDTKYPSLIACVKNEGPTCLECWFCCVTCGIEWEKCQTCFDPVDPPSPPPRPSPFLSSAYVGGGGGAPVSQEMTIQPPPILIKDGGGGIALDPVLSSVVKDDTLVPQQEQMIIQPPGGDAPVSQELTIQ